MPDDHPIPDLVTAITLSDERTFRRDEHDPDAWLCELAPTELLEHPVSVSRIHRAQMRVNLLLAAGLDVDRAKDLARELEGLA